MRLIEISTMLEGVSAHGAHLFAYAIAVAEAYDAAPVFDPSVRVGWDALVKHNAQVMFSRMKGTGITVKFVADDPYAQYSSDPAMQVRFMLWDMVVNHQLLIYSGHSDSHPVFSEIENIVFRTVHDYFTHGKLRATFKKQIEQLGLDKHKPTPEELVQILPNVKLDQGGNIGHQFTFRGELNAFVTHAKLAPKAAVPALFTEVVGQVCYYNTVGQFPTQKAAILPGFDYQNVGQAIPGSTAEKRMEEIMQQIQNGATEIQTSVKSTPVVELSAIKQRMG